VDEASGSEYYTADAEDQSEAVKKIADQLWSEGHDAGLTVRDSWREFLSGFEVNNAIDWLEGKRQSIVDTNE
jgi:hypothetical protein